MYNWSELEQHRQDIIQTMMNRSYVTLHMDSPEMVAPIHTAATMIKGWFVEMSDRQKFGSQLLFEQSRDGGNALVGYNQPTVAKELFRVRRGNVDNIKWPNEDFKNSALQSLQIFERATKTIYSLLTRDILNLEMLYQNHFETDYQNDHDFYPSPFDFFHYYNSESCSSTDNCYEHVDPGFLTIVPASAVPGLQIFDRTTGTWVSVEDDLIPFEDWVVFTGHTTKLLTQDYYLGSVHRVSKNCSDRFSVVYEWRPNGGSSF
eukprot:TRINITY_DN11540_c0_g1_i1.p1 TRINITY_DN11540_c0_g1~~TRINITY_DN11540_c0_g1_i1.p1  ORF type:complete len:261 (-),score=36.34 TRINITY_DN11540_c0_g1_i1:249-1031(-)